MYIISSYRHPNRICKGSLNGVNYEKFEVTIKYVTDTSEYIHTKSVYDIIWEGEHLISNEERKYRLLALESDMVESG